MKKFLKKVFKQRTILIMVAMVVIFTILIAVDYRRSLHPEMETSVDRAQAVQVLQIGLENNLDTIKVSGTVLPEASAEVIALTSGTLRNINFTVGQQVAQNQLLANLQNSTLSTSYSNAQVSLSNVQNTNQSMLNISAESARQAENNVANSLRAVEAAKIGVQNAENNLANALAMQTKSNQDLKNNSLTGFYEYLNLINNSLDKINYVLKVEGDSQLPGIGPVLAAKDQQTLNLARTDYWQAKKAYQIADSLSLTPDNVIISYQKIITALEDLKTLTDDVVQVLDNTAISYYFPQTALNAQKDIFTGYRSNSTASITAAKKTLQALENIELNAKRETDGLNSALAAAKNQLKMAEIGHQNAVSALQNAKQAKEQQSLVNQSSLDSLRGQMNLIGTQVADLNVLAPIAGKITKQYLEVGAEVQPGQRIAQIAQDANLKVEIYLNSRDSYRIKIGQIVKINQELEGQISLLEPAADPITKKIRVEISLNKPDSKLIIGSFADVAIPLTELRKTSATSVFVPLKAITITPNETYVFLAVADLAVKTPVAIGSTQGDLIEILAGLKTGDQVIVEGAKLLTDGDKVKIE